MQEIATDSLRTSYRVGRHAGKKQSTADPEKWESFTIFAERVLPFGRLLGGTFFETKAALFSICDKNGFAYAVRPPNTTFWATDESEKQK